MSRVKKNPIGDQQKPILKWDEFEQRFRRYLPARAVPLYVTKEQMDRFFLIAEEYRRDALNLPALDENRQALREDAKASRALMAGIKKRLDETQRFVTEFAKTELVATAILSRRATDQVASLRRDLEKEFEFDDRRVEALSTRLSTPFAQHAELEFTLDLLMLVREFFPKLKESEKRNLVVAAMAGAQCFSEDQLKGGAPPGSVPMKFSRAKKYQKEMYPEGRVYAYGKSPGKKKRKVAAGEKKSG